MVGAIAHDKYNNQIGQVLEILTKDKLEDGDLEKSLE